MQLQERQFSWMVLPAEEVRRRGARDDNEELSREIVLGEANKLTPEQLDEMRLPAPHYSTTTMSSGKDGGFSEPLSSGKDSPLPNGEDEHRSQPPGEDYPLAESGDEPIPRGSIYWDTDPLERQRLPFILFGARDDACLNQQDQISWKSASSGHGSGHDSASGRAGDEEVLRTLREVERRLLLLPDDDISNIFYDTMMRGEVLGGGKLEARGRSSAGVAPRKKAGADQGLVRVVAERVAADKLPVTGPRRARFRSPLVSPDKLLVPDDVRRRVDSMLSANFQSMLQKKQTGDVELRAPVVRDEFAPPRGTPILTGSDRPPKATTAPPEMRTGGIFDAVSDVLEEDCVSFAGSSEDSQNNTASWGARALVRSWWTLTASLLAARNQTLVVRRKYLSRESSGPSAGTPPTGRRDGHSRGRSSSWSSSSTRRADAVLPVRAEEEQQVGRARRAGSFVVPDKALRWAPAGSDLERAYRFVRAGEQKDFFSEMTCAEKEAYAREWAGLWLISFVSFDIPPSGPRPSFLERWAKLFRNKVAMKVKIWQRISVDPKSGRMEFRNVPAYAVAEATSNVLFTGLYVLISRSLEPCGRERGDR